MSTYFECDLCDGAHEARDNETIERAQLRLHWRGRFCVTCDRITPTFKDRGCRYCWAPTMSVKEKLRIDADARK